MTRLAALVVLGVGLPLAAQSPLYQAPTATGAVEHRHLRFTSGIRLDRARQTAWRLVGGIPVGRRLFIDVGTSYATTMLRSVDGITVRLSGLTDTDLRAALTLGADVAVVSVLLSLPTGTEQVPADALPLLRSIAQNFLPFPVSNYGAGLGVTTGLAGARQLGPWTVGGAVGLRYVARYSPFADVEATYDPGLETRARLGVRRALGARTQVTAGATVSTFGTDDFVGPQSFTYRSGNRYALELSVLRQVGRATARVAGWTFWRAAGDSSGVAVDRARERIVYGVLGVTLPVGIVAFDPALDLRRWTTTDAASGLLMGMTLAARIGLTRRLVLAPSLRYDTGDIRLASDVAASYRGFAFSVAVRVGR